MFLRKYLYSEIEKTGDRSHRTETLFSALETVASGVVAQIIESAERDEVPRLQSADREIWDKFLLSQWVRTPDNDDAIGTVENAKRELANIRRRMKADYPERSAEIDDLAKPENEAEILQNAKARALRTTMPRALSVISSRGIYILKITAKDRSFVLGSMPILMENFQLRRPVSTSPKEVWLPISSKIAVGVGGALHAEQLRTISMKSDVDRMNFQMATQSTEFISSTKKLGESVVSMLAKGRPPPAGLFI